MPGLDPVLLAVYSEHEGTELVEVTIMMMMIKMTIKMMTIMMTTSTMTKMMLMAVYSKLEGIELVEVTSSYFQATLDKPYWQAFRKHTLDKPYYQALQRSGASLRVLVSPGWLYRGPSVLEQVHNANHLTNVHLCKRTHPPPATQLLVRFPNLNFWSFGEPCHPTLKSHLVRTSQTMVVEGGAPPGMWMNIKKRRRRRKRRRMVEFQQRTWYWRANL